MWAILILRLKRSAGVGARIHLPMIGLMGIDWPDLIKLVEAESSGKPIPLYYWTRVLKENYINIIYQCHYKRFHIKWVNRTTQIKC